MEDRKAQSEVEFRVHRFRYIQSMFELLQHSTDMDMEIQQIIDQLDQVDMTRACSSCGKLYPARKQKCDVSDGTLELRESRDYPINEDDTVEYTQLPKYFNIGQNNIVNKTTIKMSEPALVNPNSFDSMKVILEQLKQSYFEHDRAWLFVGADAPPYCLMRRLIEQNPDEYDWLSVTAGLGHLNMNQVKTVFKILEHVMLEPLAKDVLKYNTTKSYQYFMNCKDNHKSWQALEILLHGTTMEMIRMYCADTDVDVTPQGFLQWQAAQENPTFRLVSFLILSLCLG